MQHAALGVSTTLVGNPLCNSGWEPMAKPEPRPQYQRPAPTQTHSLDRDRYSRDMGAQRDQLNRGASDMMQRSFGGRRR